MSTYTYTSTRKDVRTGRTTPLDYLWGLTKTQALRTLECIKQVTKRSRFDRVISTVVDPYPTIAREVRIAEFDPDYPTRQIAEVVITIMEDVPFDQKYAALAGC